MRSTIIYFTIIYATAVFLGGIMAYWHANMLVGIILEVPLSILIFGSLYFIFTKQYKILLLLPFFGIILGINYGYEFSYTLRFFPAIMTGISAFYSVFSIYEYLKRINF